MTGQKCPANGISQRLGKAGHTRHKTGQPCYVVTGHGDDAVAVWHCNRYGEVMAPGRTLQAYGRTLADRGYAVLVAEVDSRAYLIVKTGTGQNANTASTP